jgi:hypothetical protein
MAAQQPPGPVEFLFAERFEGRQRFRQLESARTGQRARYQFGPGRIADRPATGIGANVVGRSRPAPAGPAPGPGPVRAAGLAGGPTVGRPGPPPAPIAPGPRPERPLGDGEARRPPRPGVGPGRPAVPCGAVTSAELSFAKVKPSGRMRAGVTIRNPPAGSASATILSLYSTLDSGKGSLIINIFGWSPE